MTASRIGGLGHLAIQYAAKFGYTVVAISRGTSKKAQALELGVRGSGSAFLSVSHATRVKVQMKADPRGRTTIMMLISL